MAAFNVVKAMCGFGVGCLIVAALLLIAIWARWMCRDKTPWWVGGTALSLVLLGSFFVGGGT
jgi:hypothetical protein